MADGAALGTPAITADGTILVATQADQSELYALKPDGSLAWAFAEQAPGRDHFFDSPTVGADGTIYVVGDSAFDQGILYAVRADGTPAWSTTVGEISGYTPPIGSDGTLYAQGPGRSILALAPGGATRWSYGAEVGQLALGIDGTIVATAPEPDASADETDLLAVRPDGTPLWTSYVGATDAWAPAVGPDGTMYLIGPDRLVAVGADGARKWTATVAGPTVPAIDGDGTL